MLFSSTEAGNMSSSSANTNTHELGPRINLGKKALRLHVVTQSLVNLLVLLDSGHRISRAFLDGTLRHGLPAPLLTVTHNMNTVNPKVGKIYIFHFFGFFIRAISKLYICILINCTQLIYFINNTLKHMYCLKL